MQTLNWIFVLLLTAGVSIGNAQDTLLLDPSNTSDPGDPLTRAEFEELHAELTAPTDEIWKTIPWHSDLLSAQRLAAKQRKLIFIWSMDGHPLGCT
jgi:hypothetical protein